MTFGLVLCIALCIYGYKSFEAPMARGRLTSSSTISSACHQPHLFDRDARFFGVTYGVVPSTFCQEPSKRHGEPDADHFPREHASQFDIELDRLLPQGVRSAAVNEASEASKTSDRLTFTTYRYASPSGERSEGATG